MAWRCSQFYFMGRVARPVTNVFSPAEPPRYQSAWPARLGKSYHLLSFGLLRLVIVSSNELATVYGIHHWLIAIYYGVSIALVCIRDTYHGVCYARFSKVNANTLAVATLARTRTTLGAGRCVRPATHCSARVFGGYTRLYLLSILNKRLRYVVIT